MTSVLVMLEMAIASCLRSTFADPQQCLGLTDDGSWHKLQGYKLIGAQFREVTDGLPTKHRLIRDPSSCLCPYGGGAANRYCGHVNLVGKIGIVTPFCKCAPRQCGLVPIVGRTHLIDQDLRWDPRAPAKVGKTNIEPGSSLVDSVLA